MSVINKMLRDLDRRQGTLGAAATGESGIDLACGTVSVIEPPSSERQRTGAYRAVLAALMFMLMGMAVGGWWYLNHNKQPPHPIEPPDAPAPVSAKAAQGGIEVIPLLQKTDPVAPASLSLKMDPLFKSAPQAERLARTRQADQALAPTASLAPVTKPPSALSAQGGQASLMRPVATTPLVPEALAPVSAPLARPASALEVLAQSQSLWNTGSHEMAIDLLREALAAAERTHLAGPSGGSTAALVSLARELARMELAQGRVSQALELLTRLEPVLSASAEVWALRGNAAQRLGRHQESASAYLMALKLRPEEHRWMLGAAVSLAVQGQTASASELAEKARAGGVLSREVANYLTQLGVPLRER